MNTLHVPSGEYTPSNDGRNHRYEDRPGSRTARSVSSGYKTTLEDHWHDQEPYLHYGPKLRSWHHRPKSPGLKWYKSYTETTVKKGRVLVIDYVKKDLSKEGTRKVAAQEISDIEGLRKIYANPVRSSEAVLRLFHVQNAQWAVEFLLRKFNINAQDDLVGSDFGRYLRTKRPGFHKGKPVLNGKSWETQHDPWRGISKTAFGIDYLKPHRVKDAAIPTDSDLKAKMMELNDLDLDESSYGWDVFVQRMACYIQHKEAAPQIPKSPDIRNPYDEGNHPREPHSNQYFPHIDDLDNCNTIIIFEDSHSGSIEDTMIPARRKFESRWRRIPFYLTFGDFDISNDSEMALRCMKMIMQDVWSAVADSWDGFLEIANRHVSILEDKIYEHPADESRDTELWTNSSMWLKVERLMYIHTNVLEEVQANLREVTDEPTVDDAWLDGSTANFKKLSNSIQEDLVKPTANLADLMYKSVGIRDSRHSLQLSMSMWRLSWITFIFLPLTFASGFFGMNVDTFQGSNYPSVKWYFISVVPMMLGVLVSWFVLKHYLEQARQTPYSRGIYEHLFHDLATNYPLIWSRVGPRDYIRPQGITNRWKWSLIKRWNSANRTIQSKSGDDNDDEFDGLGYASRIKRRLTRRWTLDISRASKIQAQGKTLEQGDPAMTTVTAGMEEANEMLTAPLGGIQPEIAIVHVPFNSNEREKVATDSVHSHRRSGSDGRASSQGSSHKRNSGVSVMIEEEAPNWLENSEPKEGAV